MVSKDLWQRYKERKCRDIKRDRVVWLWKVGRSDRGQASDCFLSAQCKGLQRLTTKQTGVLS